MAITALVALLAFLQPVSLVANAAPTRLRARTAAARPQKGDEGVFTRKDMAGTELASQLDVLFKQMATGEPFAVQEREILDAWYEGLPIANVEADILLARGIYNVYLRGESAQSVPDDLIDRWRSYILAHASEILARNAQLNPKLHQDVKPPDGSRDWELYWDPALFNQLSSGYQRRLQAIYGYRGKARNLKGARGGEVPQNPTAAPANTLVNNPATDTTTSDTQSETGLILGSGMNVLASFNDSGSNVGGAAHFTGIARSTDGGATFTDQGVLPADSTGDAGDPVYARSNSTGTVILSTLGFNSGAVLQIYRTTNDGSTYSAPVNGAAGGGNHDKEWVACDNFAGSGQGNFYMFWRDFGSGGGMTFTRSTNDGVTWGSRQVLASGSGQGAWVVVGADHAVYCFWLSGTSIVMRKSVDQGVTFAPQVTVTTLRTTGTNGDLALGGGMRSNAFPQVVANPNDANQLYAVWNDKGVSPSTDKANVYFSQTTNGGTTWSAPVQVNTDAGLNDNWQPCAAITPDGTALFVSWYDRRLDLANSMIDVFARNATISGTSVTFGNDYRITDTAFPVVIGQDGVIVSTYMGDYDSAAADNSNFYRLWGDNRLANASVPAHTHQPDVRFTKIPKAGPGAIIATAGATLQAENCTPANNAIDPNETVTVSFSVTNSGTGATTSLVGTLQASGGVTSPSAPQNYGAVPINGTVAKSFTFTAANQSCGSTITASIQLQDGANNLGTITYTFTLGALGPMSTASYSSGGVMVPIPASGTVGDMTPQVINVPDVGSIQDVNVRVRLNHTFDGDLTISLMSPNGTTVALSSRRGSSGDNFGSGATDCTGTFTIFDDAAGTPIASGSAPFAGTFRPDAMLSNMNGGPANGNWTLLINDAASGDQGILFCWQIEVTRADYVCSTSCGGGGNVPPVANAGMDQSVNACTLVTLDGSGSNDPDMAPSPLTYAWSQTGGPTVTINNPTSAMATIEAPNSASSVMLTFQLTVSDGAAMVSDSVVITSNHVAGVHFDTVGLYTTAGNAFFLHNCNGPGGADIVTTFGPNGLIPLRGDYDGNGTDTIGVYDPSTSCFFLKNSNTPGGADLIVCYGAPNSVPLIGDWDGNGTDTVGTYDTATGTFFLRNSNTPGPADIVFSFGAGGQTPLVGDWDGNGTDTIGVYVPASAAFFLRNTNSAGGADLVFTYGPANFVPLAGNWDGTGGDSIGVYDATTGAYFLKNTNAGGGADIVFTFGAGGAVTPMAGNWDGF